VKVRGKSEGGEDENSEQFGVNGIYRGCSLSVLDRGKEMQEGKCASGKEGKKLEQRKGGKEEEGEYIGK
jgi:hypothetical protein